VGCKWVYKIKHDSKGNIDRFKARFMAKAFTQRERIDYNDAFSPVSSKNSFRIIMTLVMQYDLEFHQMNVKTTFLNGDLYKMSIWHNLRVLSLKRTKIWDAS
jgi:hypothetical protein